jgi:hypothetical protein
MVISGFEIDSTCSSACVLQAATSFGLSEQAPYDYHGDCNTGRVSTSITLGEKIFMELEILSPNELTDRKA